MSENFESLSVVNEHEAARILGLSVQTLRNWRHLRRGLAYCKLGRSVAYRKEDIKAFQLKNRIEPQGGPQ